MYYNKFSRGKDSSPSIEKLTAHGVNAEVVKKLLDDGIDTCFGLVALDEKAFALITGLTDEAKIKEAYSAAHKLTVSDLMLTKKPIVLMKQKSKKPIIFFFGCLQFLKDNNTAGSTVSDVIPKEKDLHFVFVENINKIATRVDIEKLFRRCGQVQHVDIVPNKTRPSYGFVYFKTREGAERAVAMKSPVLCGVGISVKMGEMGDNVDSKGSKGKGSSSGPIRRGKEGRQHPYKG